MSSESPTCVTVVMPTYNAEGVIDVAIRSLQRQSLTDWRLLVVDDASTDKTVKVAREFNDARIKVLQHADNVGYQRNLRRGVSYVAGGRVFLFAQDDVLDFRALERTLSAMDSLQVMAVTRPYYWFERDFRRPIRVKKALGYDSQGLRLVDTKSCALELAETLASMDQLSGLCFESTLLQDWPISDDMFTAHVYPLCGALTRGGVGVLDTWTVAVRTEVSQSRTVSSAYDASPLATWLTLFNMVLGGSIPTATMEQLQRKFAEDHVTGFLQIRHFSQLGRRGVLREAAQVAQVSKWALATPRSVAVIAWCLVVPRIISLKFVDWGKRHVGGLQNRSLAPIESDVDKVSKCGKYECD